MTGKLNVKDEELDEMLNEGKGPINFTVFLTLFGEKLNGESLFSFFVLWIGFRTGFQMIVLFQVLIQKTLYLLPSNFLIPMGLVLSIRMSKSSFI